MYKTANIKQSKYDTESEIEFINGLGTFGSSEKEGENKRGRKELLRGYLLAAGKRNDWGHIDKYLVTQHVKIKLLELAA